jgi:hypothetical protein
MTYGHDFKANIGKYVSFLPKFSEVLPKREGSLHYKKR